MKQTQLCKIYFYMLIKKENVDIEYNVTNQTIQSESVHK